jgi:Leucine-rich repeat (LRR) protein
MKSLKLIPLVLFYLTISVELKDAVEGSTNSTNWLDHGNFLTFWLTEGFIIKNSDFKLQIDRDEKIEAFKVHKIDTVSYLPIEIYGNFPNLKYYHSQFCSVRNLTKSNFEKLTNLIFLSLSNNRLSFIDSDVFEDLKNLRNLEVENNRIVRIDNDAFWHLRSLENFYGANNRIRVISPMLFKNLQNLRVIRLQNNKIGFVEPEPFENMSNLRELNLNGNNCIDLHYIKSDFFASSFGQLRETMIKRCSSFLMWVLLYPLREGDD